MSMTRTLPPAPPSSAGRRAETLAGLQSVLHGIRNSLETPSRSPRMVVVIVRLLAIAFLLCFATGIYSHFLQEPQAWMRFSTRPVELYGLTQGVHIVAGIACFPLILAKLYVVYPQLFQSPAVRSPGHLLERASIALFVAASLVEITIGLLNTYQWYPFPFPFKQTHYALSFVIIGSLAIHIATKLETIAGHWSRTPAGVPDAGVPHAGVPDAAPQRSAVPRAHLVAAPSAGVTARVFAWIDRAPGGAPGTTPVGADSAPGGAATSRRGFLVVVGIAVAAVVTLTGGQSFRLLDATNLFAPRKAGTGPNALPVNRTARAAQVLAAASATDWVLTVAAGSTVKTFSRDELRAFPQREVELPIACVEGWSQSAVWRGVRLRDLAAAVGAASGAAIRATSLEQNSRYAVSTLPSNFADDDLTLIALEVNGAVLDIDHGYPARLIAPARPGVLQTKWLDRLDVLV